MTEHRTCLASLICLLILASALSAPAADIDSGPWRLELDESSGAITSLAALKAYHSSELCDLFGGSGKNSGYGVAVYDLATKKTYRPGCKESSVVEVTAQSNSARVVQKINVGSELLTLSTTYTLAGAELCWRATLTGSGSGNRSYRILQELPVPDGWSMWKQTTPELANFGQEMRPFSLWYVRAPEGHDKFDNQWPRTDLTIPQVTLIDEARDLGITLAHPVDDRKPSSGFITVQRPDGSWAVQAVTALVGLRGSKPLEVTGYMVAHRGCYRPGLEWTFNKWPEYFLPDPAVYKKKGIFATGIPSVGERDPDGKFRFEGYGQYDAYFMEIHMHFPFYGLYYPDKGDPDVWPDVWGAERNAPMDSTLNLARINRSMKNLTDNGFYPFYYFGINDGYPALAAQRWAGAVAGRTDGSEALSGWRGGGIEYRNMNPDTSWAFGRDLVRQLDSVLENVKPISGLFFDTVHHNDLDFAHDDGVTLVYLDGRSVPAYCINFGYDFFLRHLSDKMRPRGMHLFINGPQAIRNGVGVDAVMLEGRGDYEMQNRRFLSCLSRPLYWLAPGAHDIRREIILQRCLLFGAFTHNPPSAYADGFLNVSKDKQHLEYDRMQFDAYVPLHEMLRGRTLCFEPDPVDVPAGCRAELFTLPDGNYALSLINENMSVFDPYSSSRPELSLRLERGISTAKIFTPLDHEGKKLELEQDNEGKLKLEIKDFKGASLVLLTPVQ